MSQTNDEYIREDSMENLWNLWLTELHQGKSRLAETPDLLGERTLQARVGDGVKGGKFQHGGTSPSLTQDDADRPHAQRFARPSWIK